MSFKSRTQAKAAAHQSWAQTPDRVARTAKARKAVQANLEAAVDPDHKMSPVDRRKAIANAQAARMLALSQKGVDARRAKTQARQRKRR